MGWKVSGVILTLLNEVKSKADAAVVDAASVATAAATTGAAVLFFFGGSSDPVLLCASSSGDLPMAFDRLRLDHVVADPKQWFWSCVFDTPFAGWMIRRRRHGGVQHWVQTLLLSL
jgi:hypothetical protein